MIDLPSSSSSFLSSSSSFDWYSLRISYQHSLSIPLQKSDPLLLSIDPSNPPSSPGKSVKKRRLSFDDHNNDEDNEYYYDYYCDDRGGASDQVTTMMGMKGIKIEGGGESIPSIQNNNNIINNTNNNSNNNNNQQTQNCLYHYHYNYSTINTITTNNNNHNNNNTTTSSSDPFESILDSSSPLDPFSDEWDSLSSITIPSLSSCSSDSDDFSSPISDCFDNDLLVGGGSITMTEEYVPAMDWMNEENQNNNNNNNNQNNNNNSKNNHANNNSILHNNQNNNNNHLNNPTNQTHNNTPASTTNNNNNNTNNHIHTINTVNTIPAMHPVSNQPSFQLDLSIIQSSSSSSSSSSLSSSSPDLTDDIQSRLSHQLYLLQSLSYLPNPNDYLFGTDQYRMAQQCLYRIKNQSLELLKRYLTPSNNNNGNNNNNSTNNNNNNTTTNSTNHDGSTIRAAASKAGVPHNHTPILTASAIYLSLHLVSLNDNDNNNNDNNNNNNTHPNNNTNNPSDSLCYYFRDRLPSHRELSRLLSVSQSSLQQCSSKMKEKLFIQFSNKQGGGNVEKIKKKIAKWY